MKQGRDTTKEERIEIAKDCLASGKNYGEMALKYKVSYQQVRTWTLRFEEMGEAGLEDRRGKRKKEYECLFHFILAIKTDVGPMEMVSPLEVTLYETFPAERTAGTLPF